MQFSKNGDSLVSFLYFSFKWEYMGKICFSSNFLDSDAHPEKTWDSHTDNIHKGKCFQPFKI